jgi:hypothetical protein
MQNRCLKCHNSTKAEKGFIIFGADGKLALQSPASLDMIMRKVITLKMPPAKPLSDEEQAKIINWVGINDEEINAFIKDTLKAKAPAAALPAAAPLPPPVPQPGANRQ